MGSGVFEGDTDLYLVLERENAPATWNSNWQSAGSATKIAVRNSEWTQTWRNNSNGQTTLYAAVERDGVPFATVENGKLAVDWYVPSMLWIMGYRYISGMGL